VQGGLAAAVAEQLLMSALGVGVPCREEEVPELERLMKDCPHGVKGGVESKHGKANILIQVGRGGRKEAGWVGWGSLW